MLSIQNEEREQLNEKLMAALVTRSRPIAPPLLRPCRAWLLHVQGERPAGSWMHVAEKLVKV